MIESRLNLTGVYYAGHRGVTNFGRAPTCLALRLKESEIQMNITQVMDQRYEIYRT